MTLSAFIDEHLTPTATTPGGAAVPASRSPGYLAQHRLFEQVPALKRDLLVPGAVEGGAVRRSPGRGTDFCYLSDEKEQEEEVRVNAWFGPKGELAPETRPRSHLALSVGTISPLHQDPDHNILCQASACDAHRRAAP
jgi:lysine-specific demethylase 8